MMRRPSYAFPLRQRRGCQCWYRRCTRRPPLWVPPWHSLTRAGRDAISSRITQMSSHDVLAGYFEHDKVRAHFARVAGENLVSPDEKATGLGVFVFLGFLEAYGFGVPVGGSGKLSEALVAASNTTAAPCSRARTCAKSSSLMAAQRG